MRAVTRLSVGKQASWVLALSGSAAILVTTNAVPAAAGPGSRSIPPPVIRESFTRLPCPTDRVDRGTTIGIMGCLERRILRTDAKNDEQVRAIFAKLHDPGARRKFAAAERSWLLYRRASCESEADLLRGGSAQPLLFADCVVRRNVEHLESLGRFHKLVSKR
jgi:uncharacterized protein YecT (DUF1311 family)